MSILRLKHKEQLIPQINTIQPAPTWEVLGFLPRHLIMQRPSTIFCERAPHFAVDDLELTEYRVKKIDHRQCDIMEITDVNYAFCF